MRSKNVLILVLILILIVVVFGYLKKDMVVDEVETPLTTEQPVFTWEFEEADTLNLDGNPNTNVFLKAEYSNGETERKLVDTTPGSCNDLPETEEDSLPDTTNIQCYSAGLGYRFKITRGETAYLVERITFEEALPDQEPKSYEYEVVSEFPLGK